MLSDDLALDIISVTPTPAVLGHTCLVELALTNVGRTAVVVNRRMAVGYRSSLSRELFADLSDTASCLPADIMVVDYDRDFALPSDYATLAPGESLECSFDLFRWYAPSNPGDYLLVMHYQADEQLARTPGDVVKGIYTSSPITIHVVAQDAESAASDGGEGP